MISASWGRLSSAKGKEKWGWEKLQLFCLVPPPVFGGIKMWTHHPQKCTGCENTLLLPFYGREKPRGTTACWSPSTEPVMGLEKIIQGPREPSGLGEGPHGPLPHQLSLCTPAASKTRWRGPIPPNPENSRDSTHSRLRFVSSPKHLWFQAQERFDERALLFFFNFIPITLIIASLGCLNPQWSHFCLQLAYHQLGLRFISNKRVCSPILSSFLPKLNLHYKKIKQKQLFESPLITPITFVNIIILNWRWQLLSNVAALLWTSCYISLENCFNAYAFRGLKPTMAL